MIFLLNTSSQGDCVQRSRRESGNEPSSFYHSAPSGHCQGAESGGPPAHFTNTDVNIDDAGDDDHHSATSGHGQGAESGGLLMMLMLMVIVMAMVMMITTQPQGVELGGLPADDADIADVTDVNVDGDDAGDGDDTS